MINLDVFISLFLLCYIAIALPLCALFIVTVIYDLVKDICE